MKKVLVTGMSGLIGSAVRQRLEGKYELVALSRRSVSGVPTHCADVSDMASIRPAFRDVDAVIHLAGAMGDDWAALLRANIVGTYKMCTRPPERPVYGELCMPAAPPRSATTSWTNLTKR